VRILCVFLDYRCLRLDVYQMDMHYSRWLQFWYKRLVRNPRKFELDWLEFGNEWEQRLLLHDGRGLWWRAVDDTFLSNYLLIVVA
jgi:hypothetical protein